jgi:hypothetical protein
MQIAANTRAGREVFYPRKTVAPCLDFPVKTQQWMELFEVNRENE